MHRLMAIAVWTTVNVAFFWGLLSNFWANSYDPVLRNLVRGCVVAEYALVTKEIVGKL